MLHSSLACLSPRQILPNMRPAVKHSTPTSAGSSSRRGRVRSAVSITHPSLCRQTASLTPESSQCRACRFDKRACGGSDGRACTRCITKGQPCIYDVRLVLDVSAPNVILEPTRLTISHRRKLPQSQAAYQRVPPQSRPLRAVRVPSESAPYASIVPTIPDRRVSTNRPSHALASIALFTRHALPRRHHLICLNWTQNDIRQDMHRTTRIQQWHHRVSALPHLGAFVLIMAWTPCFLGIDLAVTRHAHLSAQSTMLLSPAPKCELLTQLDSMIRPST